jgi:hypothetical protein
MKLKSRNGPNRKNTRSRPRRSYRFSDRASPGTIAHAIHSTTMPKRSNDILNAALDRLEKAEAGFIGSEFLAPVLRGLGVGVKIAGVRCRLNVTPRTFEGWGLFKAVSIDRATFQRDMTLAQRRQYLALFPSVRLILCRCEENQWLGLPASKADTRFSIEGLIPVRFIEDPELFQTVITRFDGGQFWYDAADDRADAAAAPYLRQSLNQTLEPKKLHRPGLSAEERLAYSLAYQSRLEELLQDEQHQAEARLRAALEHAGANLGDYQEHADVYRVSYHVDGRRHTSIVRKNDLTVVTAGICLSGGDSHFDLASLIGVLREGDAAGRIVRMH